MIKLKLTSLLIIILFVSCNQKKTKSIEEYKSKNISEHINPSESYLDSINENWVKEDSLFLAELKEILRKDESNLIEIFNIDESDKRTNLGFGYEQIESSIGKGNVSIFFNLIFKNGQIISYELSPQLPDNKLLLNRYKKFYSGIFNIENNTIYNKYFNIEEMEKPLKNINSDIILNENLRFLMTPFSGTRYGFRGGYSGSLFTNRSIFLDESKNITPKICLTLMKSINPATRLMAIEYYLKNKSNFNNQNSINIWIDKVYTELPTIETSQGCMITQKSSKQLVSEYVKRIE